jgi:hypothetical protein
MGYPLMERGFTLYGTQSLSRGSYGAKQIGAPPATKIATITTAMITIVINVECRDTKALIDFISHPPNVLFTIIKDDLLPNSYQKK